MDTRYYFQHIDSMNTGRKIMAWKLDKRYKHLRMILAVEQEVVWDGTSSEFVEFIHRSIPHLPEYLRSDMEKFYLRGEGRDRDSNGLFTKESALYYQNVRSGRAALSFLLKVMNGDAKLAL